MDKPFFDSWQGMFQVALLTISAYFALLLMLRLAGKRTLSKLNEFDFIVSVAIGSVLAAIILGQNDSWAEGVLALLLLIGLQILLSWLSVRSSKIRGIVSGQPTLLLYKGALLESQMRKERITHADILAALRDKGYRDVREVDAVVLESSGDLSVIKNVPPQADIVSDMSR